MTKQLLARTLISNSESSNELIAVAATAVPATLVVTIRRDDDVAMLLGLLDNALVSDHLALKTIGQLVFL